MSGQGRQKQSARDETGSGRHRQNNVLTYGVIIVILLAAAYFAGRYYRNLKAEAETRERDQPPVLDHRFDAFAKCLASKNAKMYGLYWCPHCAKQKEEFGPAFEYVPYVECAIKGSKEMAAECKAAGVTLFPSWQFGADPPKEGVLSLEALSLKTGCSLP